LKSGKTEGAAVEGPVRDESQVAPSTEVLARKLGLFDMTMIVMGSIIGTAIFLVPHTVASLLPSPSLMLGAWILGGVVTMAGTLVYAELARRRPHVGGQYAYLREAYHPGLAFLYGWSLLLVVQTGAMASVAVVFAQYFLNFTGLPIATWVLTTASIVALTIVNCMGVRAGSSTQNVFMALKIVAILGLIVCGAVFISGQWSLFGGSALATGAEGRNSVAAPDGGAVIVAFGAAMVPVLFSYGGSQMSTFIAGEVRNPKRNLPRGLILGVGGVVALYLGVTVVCLRALGPSQLAATPAPASAVMRLALGNRGGAIIALGIAISALGYLSQATLTSPRVYFAMARDGLFFKSVGWVHPRTQAPVVAILLQGVFATLIALSGKYERILNYVMSVEMGFVALTAASLFIFRRRDAGAASEPADYKTPGHPVTTVFFVAALAAVAVALFYRFPLNSLIGIAIMAAGIPVYFIWRGGNRSGETSASEG
jgi:APA family basic amino acid/polyamine antiporter